MSSGMTAAVLYATVTNPTALGVVPEETTDKAHHLKDGKGFRNPWPSHREESGLKIAGAMAW
jgi:N-acyl-phosphatidylethanolamine-hydrolysing phospholipase D